MARGQSLAIKCPSCGCRNWPTASGKLKRERYVHGKSTGLPDSNFKYEVTCNQCKHTWFSRHPEAHHAYKCLIKSQLSDSTEEAYYIQCTNCSEEGVVSETLQPSEDFYARGWRSTNEHILCASCGREKGVLRR